MASTPRLRGSGGAASRRGSGSFLARACRLPWASEGPAYDVAMMVLLAAEAALCAGIIARVAYTEIDWVAYMEEVAGYEAGERDYAALRGGTGPLVYPAGFVYLFAGLKALTRDGEDVERAQSLFAGFYVLTLAVVYGVYRAAGRVPLYSVVLLCLSKRMHSIFVLRLFNDGVAMLLAYGAVLLFTRQAWRGGCVVYSLAVGVKMNVLLFAPGLLLLLLQAYGTWAGAVGCIGLCGLVQLGLGLPFLQAYPVSYLKGAFDFGRVFMYKWTVNLKFLDEETFVSKPLSLCLLLLHLATLGAFAYKWLRAQKTGIPVRLTHASRTLLGNLLGPPTHALNPEYIVTTLLVSNFVGIVFARSLHYQFYAWYFHAIPFLCQRAGLGLPGTLVIFAAIEYSFGYVFPATPTSSLVLQAAHFALLGALAINLRVPAALATPATPHRKQS